MDMEQAIEYPSFEKKKLQVLLDLLFKLPFLNFLWIYSVKQHPLASSPEVYRQCSHLSIPEPLPILNTPLK